MNQEEPLIEKPVDVLGEDSHKTIEESFGKLTENKRKAMEERKRKLLEKKTQQKKMNESPGKTVLEKTEGPVKNRLRGGLVENVEWKKKQERLKMEKYIHYLKMGGLVVGMVLGALFLWWLYDKISLNFFEAVSDAPAYTPSE